MGQFDKKHKKEKDMSMFKQISIAILSMLLAVFLSIGVILFKDAKNSLEKRLYDDAQNSVATLSLSLANAADDITAMKVMINAVFDSGNFEYIALTDMDGNLIYKKGVEKKARYFPKWFADMINIESDTATANVSSGWQAVGILKIKSDEDFAYSELYKVFKKLVFIFVIIFIIFLAVLFLLLKAILKPLKTIQKQAAAITKNEFIIQKELPKTTELKDVVLAINKMVLKVKEMFEKANKELKELKEKEYKDTATNLHNRKFFINKLNEYLNVESVYKQGYSFVISFEGAITANKKIGYKRVDELFVFIAKCLKSIEKKYEDAISARVNPTEFIVVIPNTLKDDIIPVTSKIFNDISKKVKNEVDDDEVFVCGSVVEFSNKQSISEYLTHIDNAVSNSKLQSSCFYVEELNEEKEVISKERWRDILTTALKNNSLLLKTYPVVNSKDKTVLHYTLTSLLEFEDKVYSYGEFIVAASQVVLLDDVYKKVLEILFVGYNKEFESKKISIRLPYEFLTKEETLGYIGGLLKKYAKKLRFDLIIEISDRFVCKDYKTTILFKEMLDKYQIPLGIYEFIGEGGDFGYLKEIKPVYIKSFKEFFTSLEKSSLNAIETVCNSLDIDLVAMGVNDYESLKKLQDINIFKIQGKIVDSILP